MPRTPAFQSRPAALAATAASLSLCVYGVLQVADEQSSQTTLVGVEHVTLAGLTVAMLLLVPVLLTLGRIGGRPLPARTASAGLLLLSALTIVSNVRGEDPSFFAAVAVPSNLLIFGGLTWLAIGLRRGGQLPTWLAVAMPLSWILALPGSEVGGGVAAAAIWLVVARTLSRDRSPAARGEICATA